MRRKSMGGIRAKLERFGVAVSRKEPATPENCYDVRDLLLSSRRFSR